MMDWLRHHWLASDGRLLRVRYAIGRQHERLWGYEPDGQQWPYRMARYMRLSGY